MNADIVVAKRLLANGSSYSQGCSEYVCAVLNIPFEEANRLMGNSPTLVGSNGLYQNVSPGDVVGWKSSSGSGHVAIFVGEAGMTFLDVRQPGNKPRQLSSYGPQLVYKSSR